MNTYKTRQYNKRHLEIINGNIPLEKLHGAALNGLRMVAIYNKDEAVIAMVDEELDRRRKIKPYPKERSFGPKSYTEKQMKVLNGEIPLGEASGRLLWRIHQRAVENGDEDLAAKIQEQLDILHSRERAKHIKYANNRYKTVMANKPIEWKQPKSSEYTDREKQIIRNEIPLKEVHTNVLIQIHLKANRVGDIELAETLRDLINDRRAASVEKINRNEWLRSKKHNSSYYNEKLPLTKLQQRLLCGDLHWSDFEEEELLSMIQRLKEGGFDFESRLVEAMLKYKRHPRWNYPIKTREEALCQIEELFDTKIRRPTDWFTDEKGDSS